MSASNAFEEMLMEYLFNDVPIPGLPAVLYVALHKQDPGEGGNQSTYEAGYEGYQRLPVTRDSSGWSCSLDRASNTEDLEFGEATTGGEVLTHFSVGFTFDAAGVIMVYGELDTPITVNVGTIPRFKSGLLDILVD